MSLQSPTKESLAHLVEEKKCLSKAEIEALAKSLDSSTENGLSSTDNFTARKAKYVILSPSMKRKKKPSALD